MSSTPSTAPAPPYPVLAGDEQRPVRGHPIRRVRERRLGEFIGGQFSQYNLTSLLFEARTDDPAYIRIARWDPKPWLHPHPDGKGGDVINKPSFDQAKKQAYLPTQKGTTFGPSWTNHWVKVDLTVPTHWAHKEPGSVQLEFDPGCEAMIFDHTGLPLQGLTGGGDVNRRVDLPLATEALKPGKVTTLYIEVTANGMGGLEPAGHGNDPDPNRYFTLASADLVLKRLDAWRLLWDFHLLRGAVDWVDRDTVLQNKALWVANEIQNTFRHSDASSIARCRKLAAEVLGEEWDAKPEAVWDTPTHTNTTVWAVGHCHIDSCWLWPKKITEQKVARSWSTQLSLMERYPEHRFVASQAAQFEWLERLYPALFGKLKKFVASGQFIPIGGSWVENDANIPSGEAFARQLLYGQRYFLSRFGSRHKIFWLPDTFGYNAQIPQLARSAGLDYFFTQKLSWNNINHFPHNTVMWEGLDGSQIITHFSPVENYDSQCRLNDIKKAVTNNGNLDVQPNGLLLFGYGDGGGGPNETHIHNLRRARAAHNNGFTDVPKLKLADSPQNFYDEILKVTDGGKRLPTWQGDLYLEFHRGVYTSHGSIKRWNRKLEIKLHNLEWAATLASLASKEYAYPKAQIDELWEGVLFNQFHDILPGSSIRMVYEDAEREYAVIEKKADKLLNAAQRSLLDSSVLNVPLSMDNLSLIEPAPMAVVALNTLATPRCELVTILLNSNPHVLAAAKSGATQVVTTAQGPAALVPMQDAGGMGVASFSAVDANRHLAKVRAHNVGARAYYDAQAQSYVLSNNIMKVVVKGGRITSLYDLVLDRELLRQGQSSGLNIYEDYPPDWDAWETEVYSLDTEEYIAFDSVSVHSEEQGPLRASLVGKATFGNSKVTVKLSLEAGTVKASSKTRAPMVLDFEVDWQEKHRFLRFVVPTTLVSDQASYETQFGITHRPTGRNTTWDAAKFEGCAHRFVDLSEAGYGVAILSESKYGFSVEGGTLRASLLKGATYPDAHQDEGKHHFSLAVLPHAGPVEDPVSGVISAARAFNNPLLAVQAPFKPQTSSSGLSFAIESDSGTVVLDTLKRGEADFAYHGTPASGKTSVVVRLYEAAGAHAHATLLARGVQVSKASTANILEDVNATLASSHDDSFDVDLRPYEIKTIVLELA